MLTYEKNFNLTEAKAVGLYLELHKKTPASLPSVNLGAPATDRIGFLPGIENEIYNELAIHKHRGPYR